MGYHSEFSLQVAMRKQNFDEASGENQIGPQLKIDIASGFRGKVGSLGRIISLNRSRAHCYPSVMENIQGGNSSVADKRVASVGSDVHFGQGHGGLPRWVFR